MSEAAASGSGTDAVSRGARRRSQTRGAILDAAEALLAQLSATEIRVEDVAARSGVSAASIYVHFGTKDGLIAAAVDRLLAIATDAMTAAYHAEASPFERFEGIGATYLRLLLDHPAMIKYLSSTGEREPRSESERDVDARLSLLRGEFEKAIQAAVDAGQMRPIDPRLMSYFLFGAWSGVAGLALRRDGLTLDRQDVEESVLAAGQLLAEGLRR